MHSSEPTPGRVGRAAAGVVGALVLATLVSLPHATDPPPEPFPEPPPLSAPAPADHNPDPAVIGPILGRVVRFVSHNPDPAVIGPALRS